MIVVLGIFEFGDEGCECVVEVVCKMVVVLCVEEGCISYVFYFDFENLNVV